MENYEHNLHKIRSFLTDISKAVYFEIAVFFAHIKTNLRKSFTSYRIEIIYKLITSILIVSFVAYDIAWAYPDLASGGKNLAVTGLQNRQTIVRLAADLIALEMRRGGIKRLPDLARWFEANKTLLGDDVALTAGTDQVLLSVKDGERREITLRFYKHGSINPIGPSPVKVTALLSMEILESK